MKRIFPLPFENKLVWLKQLTCVDSGLNGVVKTSDGRTAVCMVPNEHKVARNNTYTHYRVYIVVIFRTGVVHTYKCTVVEF